jgi:hypothetical protein
MGAKDAFMKQEPRVIVVLFSGFLGLMVDGMDFTFQAYRAGRPIASAASAWWWGRSWCFR